MNMKVCTTCQQASAKMMRCSQCAATAYCSTACQRANWKEHKKECSKLANLRQFTKKYYENAPQLQRTLQVVTSIWASYRDVDTVRFICEETEEGGAEFHLHVRQDTTGLNEYNKNFVTAELYACDTMMKIGFTPVISAPLLVIINEEDTISVFHEPDSLLCGVVANDSVFML